MNFHRKTLFAEKHTLVSAFLNACFYSGKHNYLGLKLPRVEGKSHHNMWLKSTVCSNVYNENKIICIGHKFPLCFWHDLFYIVIIIISYNKIVSHNNYNYLNVL